MPIEPEDLHFHLSSPKGPGMSKASRPAASLGSFCSKTVVGSDLFPDLGGDANVDGKVDQRCIFVCNWDPRRDLFDAKLWIEQRMGAAEITMALDPTPASSESSAERQSLVLEESAGLKFRIPSSKRNALRLGHIPARHVKAVWIQRRANGEASAYEGVTLVLEGDSGP
jgi:hypothetical protein